MNREIQNISACRRSQGMMRILPDMGRVMNQPEFDIENCDNMNSTRPRRYDMRPLNSLTLRSSTGDGRDTIDCGVAASSSPHDSTIPGPNAPPRICDGRMGALSS